ncbi:MAG TPA: aconitase family protein, partial [Bacteroidales bacterium]|nr:aconitase family protein [Bacteroidales bacterium]
MDMVFDLEMIKAVYAAFRQRVDDAKSLIGKPLSLTEKILYAHLDVKAVLKEYERGKDYVNFRPDRIAMQDATAQMALLQFMMAGRKMVAVPSTVHCDHLILASAGAKEDLEKSKVTNKEIFEFLSSVSNKYGIGFWKPGAGIIHQVV